MWVTDLELDGEVKDVFGVGNSAIGGEGLKVSEGGISRNFARKFFEKPEGIWGFFAGKFAGIFDGVQWGFVTA